MLYYVTKVFISALLVVAISEVAKRSSGFAALIASLPLVSLLAFVWLYLEGAKLDEIGKLSSQVFWLVIPSLLLFALLPMLLKHGLGFWLSLGLSVAATTGGYLIMLAILRRMGTGM